MSFEKRLQNREFLVLAEMNTPKGVDISRFVTDARRIKAAWTPWWCRTWKTV